MSVPINPGKSTSRGRTRRTDAAARGAKALELRLSGMGYDEIATRLGYKDKSGAWRAIQHELAKAKRERAGEVVALDLMRLDALLNAVWNEALAGNLAAFDRVLKVLERRAKYFDLDGQGDSTTDQIRAAQELGYAAALVRLAEIKDTVQAKIASAVLTRITLAVGDSSLAETAWDDVSERLSTFEDGDNFG